MSQPQGNLQNLADGSQESLRALIQAIVPEAATGSNGKLSGDVVNKLTERLSELVGPGAVQDFKESRNERGELVNEEGLPVIDINEPVDVSRLQNSGSMPTPVTVEPLIPLAFLPASARETLRERRNRILDLLEEQEREADRLAEQRESEQRDEILRKRKEEAAKEKGKLNEARELQKKMGRALLQNFGKAKEKEKEEQEAQRLRDEEADKRRSPSIKKKTVAFVESSENLKDGGDEKAESSEGLDWGDVTPARLRSAKRPTLMSQALLDKHPMKMSVVERVPGGQPMIPIPPQTPRQTLRQSVDSDDESDPEHSSESETEGGTDDDVEAILDNDTVDLDFAQHQREIALEYYRTRNTIGEAAAAAMMDHPYEINERTEPQSDILQNSMKPAISQFRANRIASAYNASTRAPSHSPSTSLGASVLPASSTHTIQRAIRTGKLDADGKLVGGEVDSASEEEDQGLQEVLDLLRKGEVYNLGPDGKYIHAVRPIPNNANGSSSTSEPPQVEGPQQVDVLPPPSMRMKTSKFKASRAAAGRPSYSSVLSIPSPSVSETLSPSVTPVSHAGRSSPKMDSPTPVSSVVAERAAPVIKSPSPTKSPAQIQSPFSMIVDSPSFPMPQISQTRPPSGTGASPVVISSPSFPPALSSRRPDRPPPVVASTVKESKPVLSQARQPERNPSDVQPEKKVSRFKAERK
ncbi:hypothetical protein BDZ97DRAFT_1942325 [Flammula alnicola]|nr:hypothetical protein BDZ97DRAFT_1942325 [Flammula alnicola]